MEIQGVVFYLKGIKRKWMWRKRASKLILTKHILTENEKKEIKEFYAPYGKVTLIFHEFYRQITGEFRKEFIPDDFYFLKIDRFFNNAQKAVVLENKCYFHRIFLGGGVKQPELVCYRLNGFWYSKEDKIISIDAINKLLEKEKEVVLKQAIGSSGGRNIFFISKNTCNGNFNNNFWHIIDGIKEDLIVQKVIRQHPGLAQLNPSSVNTIRVLSMLCLDGVKVYSTALRVGREGARVDNGHSGGIHCGIKSDGTLRRVAHTDLGEEFLEHPYSKIVFENYEIPGYKKILEAVERLHPMIPHFRLVSWDMSVDEEGEPVLIEANLNYGGVSIHQMENGPLFGKDTKDILDEVFGKRTIDSGLERKFRKEH